MWGGVYESSFTCFHEAGEVPPGHVWRPFAQKSSSGVTELPISPLEFSGICAGNEDGWWKTEDLRSTISGGLSRGAVYPWHLCMWWAPRQGPGRLGVTEDAVWEGFTEVSWAGSSPSATLTEGWPVTDFQKHFPLVGIYVEPYVLLTQPKILLVLENYLSLGMFRGT